MDRANFTHFFLNDYGFYGITLNIEVIEMESGNSYRISGTSETPQWQWNDG